ncbi:dihydrofolate reductase family protein [Gorillibacterium timonense]|uniref:dihydrofolate reductase family protein n=1 Tax=Gorillibacterium timonense TaxID=1689269 RepID=UPI001F3CC594|nr:dihydrofolate reductase family protein [Gorillibacterium timonense]
MGDPKRMRRTPITTLFMLMSLDGKINSGAGDELDPDRDWSTIDGVKEGLPHYYELEQNTDRYSLNTGRVMAKIGVNDRKKARKKQNIRFILIDRKPHLTEDGVEYLCKWLDQLFIVTNHKEHPAFQVRERYDNLELMVYDPEIDLEKMMIDLKESFGVERITIQSGGTLNGELLRANLIDYVSIVIAPLLVGGKDTNTLIDGTSITSVEELNKLKAMNLVECNQLGDSYVQLKYEVIKESYAKGD